MLEVRILSRAPINGDVAHQVEQRIENPRVVGSSPTVATTVQGYSQQRLYDMLVRFQLHASCVDRSMVEQRLKQPSYTYPVLLCPAGQIGKVGSLKRSSSLGSSPRWGTKFKDDYSKHFSAAKIFCRPARLGVCRGFESWLRHSILFYIVSCLRGLRALIGNQMVARAALGFESLTHCHY